MPATANHEFDRGFIVDEERLRKLHEIITSRLQKVSGNPPLRYGVFRGNTTFFETESTDVVVREDNDDWRAITKLELRANREGELGFKLTLSSTKGCQVEIVGDDRDMVFLLFSDVRDFINTNMLASRYRDDRAIAGVITTVVMFLSLVVIFSTAWSATGESEHLAALASTDVMAKLDYLIRSRERPGSWTMLGILFPLAFLPLALSTGWIRKLINVLQPANLFLFGQQKARFDHRKGIVDKIWWVVVIGSVVGIGTGFIVYFATKPG